MNEKLITFIFLPHITFLYVYPFIYASGGRNRYVKRDLNTTALKILFNSIGKTQSENQRYEIRNSRMCLIS